MCRQRMGLLCSDNHKHSTCKMWDRAENNFKIQYNRPYPKISSSFLGTKSTADILWQNLFSGFHFCVFATKNCKNVGFSSSHAVWLSVCPHTRTRERLNVSSKDLVFDSHTKFVGTFKFYPKYNKTTIYPVNWCISRVIRRIFIGKEKFQKKVLCKSTCFLLPLRILLPVLLLLLIPLLFLLLCASGPFRAMTSCCRDFETTESVNHTPLSP
jgi:hypothetical protein